MIETNDLDVPERRESGQTSRVWWAISRPRRLARFNRWRKTPRLVTRGFLLFRDIVMIGFVTAIVLAGISTVRGLRAEDCRSTNARRQEVEGIFKQLVDNDQNLIELADGLTPGGLPDSFKRPLLDRYAQQLRDIDDAYRLAPCPGRDLPDA